MAQATVAAGLKDLPNEVPVGKGYVQASFVADQHDGLAAKLEAGFRPLESLGLFAYAEATPKDSSAGLGARWTF